MSRISAAGAVFAAALAAYAVGASVGAIAALGVAVVAAAIVAKVGFSGTGQRRPAPAAPEGWLVVAMELRRSRRHARPLAVLRMDRRGSGSPQDVSADTERIRGLTRAVDHVWADGQVLYVLLPEADGATAAGFEARLVEAVLPGVSSWRIRSVIFPQDGVTLGALRERLEAAFDREIGSQPLPELIQWQSDMGSRTRAG